MKYFIWAQVVILALNVSVRLFTHKHDTSESVALLVNVGFIVWGLLLVLA